MSISHCRKGHIISINIYTIIFKLSEHTQPGVCDELEEINSV